MPRLQKGDFCRTCPLYPQDGVLGGGAMPADVMFITDPPTIHEAQYGNAYTDRGGQLLLKTWKELTAKGSAFEGTSAYFCPSLFCHADKPKKDLIERCAPLVHGQISSVRPKMIIPLGNNALKSLGFTETITKARGNTYQRRIANQNVLVMPAFSAPHVLAVPGIYQVFKRDLERALVKLRSHTYGESVNGGGGKKDWRALTPDYVYPKTAAEVKDLVDHILAYCKGKVAPEAWLLALDTETNTLKPWRPGAKMIMVSVAWDVGKSAAIILDHKAAPKGYDRDAVWEQLERLFTCDKPKSFHNGKFDLKFIEDVYGTKLTRLRWDSLYGEHNLSEAKKGFYGLKELTDEYAPEFSGYEDDLTAHLDELKHAYVAKRVEDRALEIEVVEEALAVKKEELKNVKVELRETKKGFKKGDLTETDIMNAENMVFQVEGEVKEFKEDLKVVKADVREYKKRIKKLAFSREDSPITYEDADIELLSLYAAIDADIGRRVAVRQFVKSQEEDREFAEIIQKATGRAPTDMKPLAGNMLNLYLPASQTLKGMEFEGFKVNFEYLDWLEAELDRDLKYYEKRIYQEAGKEFKINSPKEAADILVAWQGLPVLERTKKGAVRLNKDVLKAYATEHGSMLALLILNYRSCHKARNTFISQIRRLSKDDGHIHTNFHVNGTATGRLSSSRMNLQNLPKYFFIYPEDGGKPIPRYNLKKIFVPSRPGYVLVDMDYNAAEVRTMTATGYAPDPKLIRDLNAGRDVHSSVTSIVFDDLSYEEVANREELYGKGSDRYNELEEIRRQIKRTTFGVVYGMMSHGLSKQLGISQDEAQVIIDKLFAQMPSVLQYIEQTKWEVENYGFVYSLTGQRRRFPLARFNEGLLWAAQREAVNFKIQNFSSQIVTGQLAEINQNLTQLKGFGKITVHDSIVFEVPYSMLPHLPAFLDKWARDRVGERYPVMNVPFVYDADVGLSYGETIKLADALKGGKLQEDLQSGALTGLSREEYEDALDEFEEAIANMEKEDEEETENKPVLEVA